MKAKKMDRAAQLKERRAIIRDCAKRLEAHGNVSVRVDAIPYVDTTGGFALSAFDERIVLTVEPVAE